MSLRRASLLSVALLICVPVAGADVIVLRDGSEALGQVTSCDDEVCAISGRRISLADIARIRLGTAVSARATKPGAVLTDGTFRPGSFSGLTLGDVGIGGDDIDRNRVAEIILTTSEPDDVVIRIDGTMAAGPVTTCNAASCVFRGDVLPLASVMWIGIGQEGNSPPQPPSPDVVYVDGSPVNARLSALDAQTVRTTRGSHPRQSVTWIRLAAPAPAPGDNRPIYRDTPQPPEPPQPPIGDPPPPPEDDDTPPPPAPPPPPNYGAPNENLPRGRLWTGKLVARLWDSTGGSRQNLDVNVDVRLREYTRTILSDGPARAKVAEFVFLNEEATVVKNKYSSRDNDETCTAEGQTTVNHPTTTWTSAIYRRTAAGPMPALMVFDIRANAPFYMLAIGPYFPPAPSLTVRCTSPDGPRTYEMQYLVPMAGTLPTGTVSFDPQIRYLQNNQMIGSYEAPGRTFQHASVAWAICLEGTACPPPRPPDNRVRPDPPPRPDDPDCPPPAIQTALLDTALRQRDLKLEQLKTIYDEYKLLERNARNSQNDFEQAMRNCNLWGIARMLSEFLVGNLGVGTAAARSGATRAIQGFEQVLGTIEKVLDNDPSWVLPDNPDLVGIDSELVWDAFSMGYDNLTAQNATPQELRSRMLGCGAPQIDGVIEGALAHLRTLEAIKPLADRMNTRRNEIRQLEIEIEGERFPDYQTACRAYEACREGGDPSRCNNLPPR
jgi:hypothetical protein